MYILTIQYDCFNILLYLNQLIKKVLKMAQLKEIRIRTKCSDPDLFLCSIRLDFESDKYLLVFSSLDRDIPDTILHNQSFEVRLFKSIDSANRVAFDLGFNIVSIDNQLECFDA